MTTDRDQPGAIINATGSNHFPIVVCQHAVNLTLRRCALCDSVDQMTINDLRMRLTAAEAERDMRLSQYADAKCRMVRAEAECAALRERCEKAEAERDNYDEVISHANAALFKAGVLPGGDGDPTSGINVLAEERDEARVERDEYTTLFGNQYDADMRGIKAWQEKNPGNELVWPDRAYLVEWLLVERDQARAREAKYREALAAVLDQYEGNAAESIRDILCGNCDIGQVQSDVMCMADIARSALASANHGDEAGAG